MLGRLSWFLEAHNPENLFFGLGGVACGQDLETIILVMFFLYFYFVCQYNSTWEFNLLDGACNCHIDGPLAKRTSLESSRKCELSDAAQEITFCRIEGVNTL